MDRIRGSGTYATFSTPIARRALQFSIISPQHFCTLRLTSRYGFSCCAAPELSVALSVRRSEKQLPRHTDDTQPVTSQVSMSYSSTRKKRSLKPKIQVNFHFMNKIRYPCPVERRTWTQGITDSNFRGKSTNSRLFVEICDSIFLPLNIFSW